MFMHNQAYPEIIQTCSGIFKTLRNPGIFRTVEYHCRSGHHYFTTSFQKAWTQVLHKFKSCSLRVGDSQWWRSLIMVPAGNKAKRISSVNHTTETIHHHHHLHIQNPDIFRTRSIFRTLAFSQPWYIQNAGIFKIRGIFRTLPNIYDEAFCENN